MAKRFRAHFKRRPKPGSGAYFGHPDSVFFSEVIELEAADEREAYEKANQLAANSDDAEAAGKGFYLELEWVEAIE